MRNTTKEIAEKVFDDLVGRNFHREFTLELEENIIRVYKNKWNQNKNYWDKGDVVFNITVTESTESQK